MGMWIRLLKYCCPHACYHSHSALRENGQRGESVLSTCRCKFHGLRGDTFCCVDVLGATNRWWNDDTRDWLAAENEDVYTYFGREIDVQLSYALHCKDNPDLKLLYSLTDDVVTKIGSKCKKARTVCFMQWAGPFVTLMCDCVCGCLCALFGRPNSNAGSVSSFSASSEENENGPSAEVLMDVRALLKRCMLLLALSIAFMYCSLYVSGAVVNLGSALLCLGAIGTTFLFIWIYLELDHQQVAALARTASFAQYAVKLAKSDWTRAIAIGSLHVFIPLLGLLDLTRQALRRLLGKAKLSENEEIRARQERFPMLTEHGSRIYSELATWNWTSIFQKVILLAELFLLLVVGSKFTFVFFSWLNESISGADLNFGVASLLVFVSGLLMFLCPIVPGSAVYLFAGVVLGAQAQIKGSVGFGLGTTIACIIGSAAKLLACVGQYLIGYVAGKSVKVQQFVGVDKVPTRAMEQVLTEPGMSPGKMCLLVAGPDFPVSMLCGILKINIPQMLLGTCPVIFVSIVPQTLVGALLTKDGGETGIWSMISTAVTGAAAIFQAAATFIYMYFIMKTIESDGERLAVYRPEHAAVAARTMLEKEYTEALSYVTTWDSDGLSCLQRFLILTSVGSFLVAGFLVASDFVVNDKYCFRSFSITDSIDASIEMGGLDKSALNLVLGMGWVALSLALFGFILDFVFKWLTACSARRRSGRVHLPTSSSADSSADT